jgi:dTDP-4-dehydrorhamnose reductase
LDINADNLRIGTSADVALKARRPLDMTLDVAKLESILNMSFPTMAEEIKHTAKEYLNE